MAKLRPAGKRKEASALQRPGAVPCVVIIIAGMLLLALLFYSVLASSSR
jgi:hypothetical protein